MKGYTKLIGEKGNIHMENIPDQEEVEYPIKEDLWNTESNIVRYQPEHRSYTPLEVRVIVDALGEP